MSKPLAERPRCGRRRWLPAVLAALVLAAPAPILACAPGLSVAAFPGGEVLAEVDLTRAEAAASEQGQDHSFALIYLHSVTLTPVESRYRLGRAGFRQVADLFSQHGPGLAAEAAAGAPPWRIEDGRFLVALERDFERIILRADPEYRNRLVADGIELDLTQWGRRALELRPKCSPGLATEGAVGG